MTTNRRKPGFLARLCRRTDWVSLLVTLLITYSPTLTDWAIRLRDVFTSLLPDSTVTASACPLAGETQTNVFENMYVNTCDQMITLVVEKSAADHLRITVY